MVPDKQGGGRERANWRVLLKSVRFLLFVCHMALSQGAEDMQVSICETQILPELPVPNNHQQGNDFKGPPLSESPRLSCERGVRYGYLADRKSRESDLGQTGCDHGS